MLLIIRCKSRNYCAYIDAVFNEIFHRFNEKFLGLEGLRFDCAKMESFFQNACFF